MIDRAVAIQLSGRHFPAGPEYIAQQIGVRVEREDVDPIEGWCLQYGSSAIICINSRATAARQRFTLAHELSHLILGTPPGVLVQHFSSDSAEERQADALAGELLLPLDRVRSILAGHLPVDMASLQRLAKTANVSDLCTACRLVNLATDLGLAHAAVIRFDTSGRYQWRYARGLGFTDGDAESLNNELGRLGGTVRQPRSDGTALVASALQSPYGSTMFLQITSQSVAAGRSMAEQSAALRQTLFANDRSTECSVASKMGHVRTQLKTCRVDEAYARFYTEFLPRWPLPQQILMQSSDGQRYVRMELSKWCLP